MHEHNACAHFLHYCAHCDVVYCTLCKREWGQRPWGVITYPWTTVTGTASDNVPYTVTFTTSGTSCGDCHG